MYKFCYTYAAVNMQSSTVILKGFWAGRYFNYQLFAVNNYNIILVGSLNYQCYALEDNIIMYVRKYLRGVLIAVQIKHP